MAKMFAGEAIAASFGAEAAIPVFGEVAMGIEAAFLGAFMIGKKIKKHRDEKKSKKQ